MNLRKIFLNSESMIFMVSQVVAGALNYLFQVYAARTLTVVDFGSWSHWLAQFSVACFVGVWLQSLSALGEMESYFGMKKSRWLLLGIITGMVISSAMNWLPVAFFFGWTASLLGGYWGGIHLRGQSLRLLALASVVGASSRFLWVFLDQGSEAFHRATLAAPMFVCLIFMVLSRRKQGLPETVGPKMNFQVGLAALGLAFFSAWIPQVDLLMAPKLLSANELGILASVCLASKACFFGFQILAQLLLAHQVKAKGVSFSRMHFLVLGICGVLISLGAVGAAQFFGWPASWTFLNLLHATTLCLLFLGIQDLCARHRGSVVIILCLISVALALSGASLKKGIEIYWLFMILGELVAICWVVFRGLRLSRLLQNKTIN